MQFNKILIISINWHNFSRGFTYHYNKEQNFTIVCSSLNCWTRGKK
jgi:hypothetical protein